MNYILEEAEEWLREDQRSPLVFAGSHTRIIRSLVAELKATRAENERLRQRLAPVKVVPDPPDFELPWA